MIEKIREDNVAGGEKVKRKWLNKLVEKCVLMSGC